MPPWPGWSGRLNAQRTTSEPARLGSVEKRASTLHWVLLAAETYSSRGLRLSTITTLRQRLVAQVVEADGEVNHVARLGERGRGHLHQLQLRFARRLADCVDGHGLVELDGRHRVAGAEEDLHGVGVLPGDGRLCAAGEEGHFGLLEGAEADNREVLVRPEAVLEAARADRAGHRPVALARAHGHRRPGGRLIGQLDVLLRADGRFARGRRRGRRSASRRCWRGCVPRPIPG